MIGKKMQQALNDQVNAELYSAYLYLAMSAYFHSENLPGSASWMRVQAAEEVNHAMKIFDFVNERAATITLKAIDKPQPKWDSPLDAFKAALKHEKYVTSRINDLVNIAQKEKDHATNSFLQWFVDEQVEEESSVDEIVNKLKMLQKAPGGSFIMDRELAQRKTDS